MRWWRWVLLTSSAVATATAATLVAIAVNVATGGSAPWLPAVEQQPLWWSAGGTAAVAVAGVAGWWTQGAVDRQLPLVPAEQRPEPWIVGRPREVDQIVDALLRSGGRTVGVTTSLQGAGGFGKTTVAKLVRADRRILRRFGDRVYWVTVGRDARSDVLTDKVNDLIRSIDPDRKAAFTSAQQAGQFLSALLRSGPPRLIVLDDVWHLEQLEAFPPAGRSSRLVTTRNSSLTAGAAVPVRVDQLSLDQARAVLVADLPDLPPAVLGDLLLGTGRWPLLLRLINRVLVDQARLDTNLGSTAQRLLDRLRREGMSQVDQLTGAADRQLDVDEPQQRQQAIATTIDASVGLLNPAQRARLAELSIFAADEPVPVTMAADLWRLTGGLDLLATRALCARLEDLALVSLAPSTGGGAVRLHDVIREVLHGGLGRKRLRRLHERFLETLSAAAPPVVVGPAAGSARSVAWWDLAGASPYLQDHLIEHLQAAGRGEEATALACDLRWVTARLEQSGPIAPLSDLALLTGLPGEHLRQVFGRTAHLLGPTEPAHSQADVLFARLEHDPTWGPQIARLVRTRRAPALVNDWLPPDLPDPRLRLSITGHTGPVRAVAIAPRSDWLATASSDRTVRLWNAATGAERMTLTGHTDRVNAVAVSPDGSWLASAGADRTVRLWDVVTGTPKGRLTGHRAEINALAIAPDGSWLSTVGDDGTVRVWDPATARQRAKLTGHSGRVTAVAIEPRGAWLATASEEDRSVRIWDVRSGRELDRLALSTDWARSVAISPDGAWLAIAGWSLRIWKPATGEQRTDFAHHFDDLLKHVAVAPDGAWLVTAGDDRTTRTWSAATGEQLTNLKGHLDPVNAVAVAPDGSWLATASSDWSVRIWEAAAASKDEPIDADRVHLTGRAADRSGWFFDVAFAPDGRWLATGSIDHSIQFWSAATGQRRARHPGRAGRVNAVAISPDGRWAASAGWSVRVWETATEDQRLEILGHIGRVFAVATAPDGAYLVTGGEDRTVRIWDPVTGSERRRLLGHRDRVNAVAVSPDGRKLATASSDRTIRIWDAATGAEKCRLTGHGGRVNAVAFAPDGRRLATAGDDRTARVWDVATGAERHRLIGHVDRVNAVAFSPDGERLATAGSDRTICVWAADSGSVLAVTRLEQAAHACAWSPVDGSLAVAGAGGLYRFTLNQARPAQ